MTTTSSRAQHAAFLAFLAATPLGTTACGGEGDGASGSATATAPGRPVSDAQALLLARTLQRNRERGGARFVATFEIAGRPVHAEGRVDFRDGRGTMRVAVVGATTDVPPRAYYWTRRAVLAQAAPRSRRYLREPPAPREDPVHAVVGFVNLLAAETIDNTANIRDQGARLLRTERLGGREVGVYRYGRAGRVTMWVGDDATLHRVRNRSIAGGLTVALLSHEPIAVRLPAGADGTAGRES